MPTSTHGHTHGLLIADLYSMYVSFFPLKSKTSHATMTALNSFFSFQGIPSCVYSDNDPSFQGEVDFFKHLFSTKRTWLGCLY
jgi:hypothetical protein